MSNPLADAAAPKEPAAAPSPPPATQPAPTASTSATTPLQAAPTTSQPTSPPSQPLTPSSGPAAAVAPSADELAAKVKELDEALKRANSYAKAERDKRVLATLRAKGAVATDATLLMLAGDADPDTVDGQARLDRLREIEPIAFRQVAPDQTAVVIGAIKQAKAPDGYKGRFNDDYAKRVAAGVLSRANGGE